MEGYRNITPQILRQLYQRRRALTLSELIEKRNDSQYSELQSSSSTPGQTRPATPGQTRPATPGQGRPATPGQTKQTSTTATSRGFTEEPTKRSNTELFPFVCEIDSLDVSKTLLRQFSVEPPNNVCQRNDTLASPSVSPVSWMLLHKCKTANDRASSSGKDNLTYTDDETETEHTTDADKSNRRRSSLSSMPSSFDEEDEEELGELNGEGTDGLSTCPPIPFRERRKAIFDSKSLHQTNPLEEDAPLACEETDTSSLRDERPRRRKRSSADLGIHYPGDLLSQARPRRSGRPLNTRNTIADFANTKAYQASTASLISACEQDKKVKTSFSLLKLIDKKSHRSKDSQADIGDVLTSLKRSEFKDDYLSSFKNARWYDVMNLNKSDVNDDDDNDDVYDDDFEAEKTLQTYTDYERKRREAVWELFTSECVFLIDHLMVLKHCFMEPLKQVQVEGHLMFTEPQDLFGNLDEVCSVSYTFCCEFISLLLKDARASDFGRTEILIQGLSRFCQLTRDGEVYHDYCLNYSKAMTYLEQLRKNEDFVEFEKWCEIDRRCHRLQLTDLLISPMQHCTKVPLLLNNICKYTPDADDQRMLMEKLQKLEESLKNLEAKMNWLKNFERIQEIQQQIIWQPITEIEPKAFIPDFMRPMLIRQPCERLLASPKRQLLYEGPVCLLEISKTVDMYMFLFDDILLLTKVKKPARKQKSLNSESSSAFAQSNSQTDGAVFVVYRQPIALDRFSVHDVRTSETTGMWCHYAESTSVSSVHNSADCQIPTAAAGADLLLDSDDESVVGADCSGHPMRSNIFLGCLSTVSSCLKNTFVLVQITRFQQIIGVYTLQAPSEAAKVSWLTRLPEAQERYRRTCAGKSGSTSSTSDGPTGGSADQDKRVRPGSSSGTSPTTKEPRPPWLTSPVESPRTAGVKQSPKKSSTGYVIANDHVFEFDYSNSSSFDSFDSFSVSRFDLHERRSALHEGSSEFPLSAAVSSNGDGFSQMTSSPSRGSGGAHYLCPPQNSQSVASGGEGLDRMRAKSMRSRQTPKMKTIREKSQSIDVIYK